MCAHSLGLLHCGSYLVVVYHAASQQAQPSAKDRPSLWSCMHLYLRCYMIYRESHSHTMTLGVGLVMSLTLLSAVASLACCFTRRRVMHQGCIRAAQNVCPNAGCRWVTPALSTLALVPINIHTESTGCIGAYLSVGDDTPPDAMILMQCAPLRSSSLAALRTSTSPSHTAPKPLCTIRF